LFLRTSVHSQSEKKQEENPGFKAGMGRHKKSELLEQISYLYLPKFAILNRIRYEKNTRFSNNSAPEPADRYRSDVADCKGFL
jgi:hypothetical protein